MAQPENTRSRDYQDFRFRLRNDHLLRQRLRLAKQEVVITIAKELGFNLTLDDLRGQKRKGKESQTTAKRSPEKGK